MRIFPTTKQWKSWTLPSKLTAIGTYITVISFSVYLITLAYPNGSDNKVLSPEIDYTNHKLFAEEFFEAFKNNDLNRLVKFYATIEDIDYIKDALFKQFPDMSSKEKEDIQKIYFWYKRISNDTPSEIERIRQKLNKKQIEIENLEIENISYRQSSRNILKAKIY